MNLPAEKDRLRFTFPGVGDAVDLTGESPLFRFWACVKGCKENNVEISSRDYVNYYISEKENSICVDFSPIKLLQAGSVGVSIRFANQGSEVLAEIHLDIKGLLVVHRVQFPLVEWDRVNTFDSLLMSSPWGDSIPRPTQTIRQYCMAKSDYWIYDYVKCDTDEVIYTYPSVLSMQYMTLYNKVRSFYLSCYSTGDDTLTLNAKVLGKYSLALSVNHYPFTGEGTWESPLCGFSILPGDWHSSADLYTSHMKGKFKNPDVPVWMKDERIGWHGWVEVMMHLEGQKPKYRFKDLPRVFRRIQELGLDTIQIAGWSNNGFDTLYPDYDIDPVLGTIEDLRLAIEEIKGMGGHAILYTNGRLVDPASRFYKNGGESCICIDEKGNPYYERYESSVRFQVVCPSCGEYRHYFAEQMDRLAEEYGADAAQIDQISCNHACFCYDSNHPHSTPANNFLPGVEKELQEARKAYRRLEPEFFIWCEGCHERFGQFYDIEQGHGEELTWQIGKSMPEQFLYNYPDRVVTGFSITFEQLCHSFCQGKPFDTVVESLENEDFSSLLKTYVSVRKKYAAYFVNGIFCDSIGLTVEEGIRVFSIKKRDGKGLLVNLWVAGAGSCDSCGAHLKNPRPGWLMKAINPAIVDIFRDGQWLEIQWKGPVVTLVFEEE